MGKVVLIVGLPGTGKTTVVLRAVKLAKKEGIKLREVNYGSLMLEKALEKNYVSGRDGIRKLPLESQEELQRRASEEITGLREREDIVIVDTHMIVNTPRGWWPGISVKNLKKVDPEQIILIEAQPSEILKRRRKDASRIRDIEEIDKISKELLYSRDIAASCSVLTGSPVSIVMNKEGKLEEVAERVLNIIRRMRADD